MGTTAFYICRILIFHCVESYDWRKRRIVLSLHKCFCSSQEYEKQGVCFKSGGLTILSYEEKSAIV